MTSLREQFIQASTIALETQVGEFLTKLPDAIKDATTKAQQSQKTDNKATLDLVNGTKEMLMACDAYRKLYAYCADPNVDMKIDYNDRLDALTVYFQSRFGETVKEIAPRQKIQTQNAAAPKPAQ